MGADPYADPNWGAPAAPAAAPALETDPASPNWGLPKTPVFRGGNQFDAAGQPIARDDPGLWGRLQSAWTTGNTPLVPQIGQAAHALANMIDQPSLGDQALNEKIPGLGTLSAQLRGFSAGTVQGAGDLAMSFTSPVGIALALVGLGEDSAALKVLPSIKPYLNTAPVNAIRRAVQGVTGLAFTGEGAKTVIQAKDLGDVGRGLTQTAAGLAGALSAVTPRASLPDVPTPRLTPQEAAANTFAQAEGIPLDAATATGSRWARNAQKIVANSIGGEGTATDLITRQQQALTATGQRLAAEVSPVQLTDRQVGQALEGALVDTIGREGGAATKEYAGLRALEADPQYAAEVPAPKASADAAAQVAQRLRTGLGYAPNTGELAELRRMAEEMGALPYVKRTWTDVSGDYGKQGNAGVGDLNVVAGAAGAPVYDDILKSLRSSDYVPTRDHVERMIRDTLETGHVNEVSRAAFDVAQRRLASDPAVSKPALPPSAGVTPEPPPVTMGMPVALKPLQDAMRPDHARLMAEAQVAPLMGSKAEAARVLDRLMQAPEWVPVSVADSVLGELKGVSRADVPALRTEGQAIAAKAVQTLSQQVDEIVSQVPGASEMLTRGRAATVRKFAAADVLKDLQADPVRTFNALTGPGNTQLDLLEQVQQQAPQLLPQIGRAKLDQLLNLATERGRFQHTDKLYADWQKMGADRKALLFGGPDQVQALDDFFLLAKRIGENPNPSGTAHTLTALNVTGQPITWTLAKLLYTPGGVRAISKFLDADLRVASGTAKGAARDAAWANVAMAAQQAGVPGLPIRYPLAAGPVDQPDTRPEGSPR
jgi:hypothetical protein